VSFLRLLYGIALVIFIGIGSTALVILINIAEQLLTHSVPPCR
jgi:hypothetical protein